MAEVVVQTKKPIFTKALGISILFLVVFLNETRSSIIVPDYSSSSGISSAFNIPLESGELSPHEISKKSDVLEKNGENNHEKLTLTNQLAKYLEAISAKKSESLSSQIAPEEINKISRPAVQESVVPVTPAVTEPELYIPGASLWNIMKNSFFQPEIARESSSSLFPKLKTPKQAWDDLLANAKTGFKLSSSPFHYDPTGPTQEPIPTPSTTPEKVEIVRLPTPIPTVEASAPRNSQLLGEDAQAEALNRGERQIGWSSALKGSDLAWNTVKFMGGIGKGLLSSYLTKGITVEHPTEKYNFLHEKLKFNQGVLQAYKGKIRDLALLNFLHKDKKASAIQNILGNGGWGFREPGKVVTIVPTHTQVAQPAVVNSGWTGSPVITVQSPLKAFHPLLFDTSLITEPLKAKVNTDTALITSLVKAKFDIDVSLLTSLLRAKFDVVKHLTLAKFLVAVELVKAIPVAFEIKVQLLKAFLHFLHHKDKYAFFRALKILNYSLWQGKRQFLQVLLKLTEYKGYPWKGSKYGLKASTWKYEPYGSSAPTHKHPSTTYGSCSSCSGHTNTYGAPSAPVSSYGTPPDTSYGAPHLPEKNPLYSYPTNFDHHASDNTYATLPPVVIPPVRSGRDGQSKTNEYSQVTQDSMSQPQTPQNAEALLQSFGSEDKGTLDMLHQLREARLVHLIKSLESSKVKSNSPSLDSSAISVQQESPKEDETNHSQRNKFSSTLLHSTHSRRHGIIN